MKEKLKNIGKILTLPGHKIYIVAAQWVQNDTSKTIAVAIWLIYVAYELIDSGGPGNLTDWIVLIVLIIIATLLVRKFASIPIMIILLLVQIITLPFYMLHDMLSRTNEQWMMYYMALKLDKIEELEELFGYERATQIASKKFDKKIAHYERLAKSEYGSSKNYNQENKSNAQYQTGQSNNSSVISDYEKAKTLFMVSEPFTMSELKTQYKRLMKAFHPDQDDASSEYASQINTYYELLKEKATD
ncbi:MAG: J domain-containing protein [Lachnospiraceae bacterium]|nr:J domain-containing protein [Lachnospiraceae bacterium]